VLLIKQCNFGRCSSEDEEDGDEDDEDEPSRDETGSVFYEKNALSYYRLACLI